MPGLNVQRSAEVKAYDRTAFVVYIAKDLGGGNKQRIDLKTRFVSLDFTQGGKKANKIKLVILDLYLQNSTTLEFVRGGKLIVQWGYPGRMGPERKMVIQKVRGNHKLTIEGLARTSNLHGEQKPRSFLKMKVSDVVKKVLGENGWQPNELNIEDTEVVHDVIVQHRQTDAQFIASLAKQEGFEWGDDFDGFRFKRAEYEKPPTREYRYYTHQEGGDIIKFETDGQIVAHPTEVSVKGIDPKTGQIVEQKANNDSTKRGGTSPTVTARRLAQGGDANVDAARATDRLGTAYKKPVADVASAKRVADAKFIGATRASFKLKMEVIGDPQQPARTVVQVSNIGKQESGRYYLQTIEDHLKAGSFTQKIEGRTDYGQGEPSKAKKAAAGSAPAGREQVRKLASSSDAQNALDRLDAKVTRPTR